MDLFHCQKNFCSCLPGRYYLASESYRKLLSATGIVLQNTFHSPMRYRKILLYVPIISYILKSMTKCSSNVQKYFPSSKSNLRQLSVYSLPANTSQT